MPKNYLKEGKYGPYNIHNISYNAASVIVDALSMIGDQANENAINELQMKLSQPGVCTADKGITGKNSVSLKMTVTDKNVEKDVIKTLLSARNALLDELDHPKKENEPYLGLVRFASLVLDSMKGNYSEAVSESPYMNNVRSLFVNSLNFHKYTREEIERELGDETDPVTGKKVPLSYITEYYNHSAELLELEYEKQRMRENPSPQKEQEYLARLSDVYTRFTDNMERFTAFAEKHVDKVKGTSKYDKYMQNILDMFTGTVLVRDNKGDNRRNTRDGQAWIRGMNQAIKNGWSLDELEILGSLEAFREQLITQQRQMMIDDNPDNLKATIKKNREDLQIQQSRLPQLEEQIIKETDEKVKKNIQTQLVTCRSKIERYTNQIQTDTDKLNKYPTRAAAFQTNIALIDDLKKSVWDKKVTNARDKMQVINSISAVMDTVSKDANLGNTKDYYKKLSKFFDPIKNTVNEKKTLEETHGRKIVELPSNEEVIDDKFLDEQSLWYIWDRSGPHIQDSIIKNAMPKIHNKIILGHNKVHKGLDDMASAGDVFPIIKKGLHQGMAEIKMNAHLDGDDKKLLSGWLKEIHDGYKDYIANLPAGEKIFKPYHDLILKELDIRNGNMAKATNDNSIVTIGLSAINFGPAIFKDYTIPGNNYLPKEDVKKSLSQKGTLLPLMSYYGGLGDVLDAEYYKQRAMKKGWNADTEKRYFFYLSKAYDKVLKAFNELCRFPDDIQDHESYDMEDSLRDLTGRGNGNKNRHFSGPAGSIRWELQAMKNGWHADNIAVMRELGYIEGMIEFRKYKLGKFIKDANTEEEKLKYEQQLKDLKDFEKKQFSTFKNTLWNKKIEGPGDVLEVLNIADAFYTANKDLKIVQDLRLLNNAFEGAKVIFNKINNDCINAIPEVAKNPDKWITPKQPESLLPESEAAKEDVLKAIRGSKDLPADAVKMYIMQYVKMHHMGSVLKEDFPALTDSKNELFNSANKVFDAAIEKYADEFLAKLSGGKENIKKFKMDGDQLADLLKYGRHENYFDSINKTIDANIAVERYERFVGGMFEKGPDGKRINIDTALKNADKNLSDVDKIYNNSFFFDVRTWLDEIRKEKKSFDKTLKEKMAQGKPVVIDAKKYDKFCKKVNGVLKMMIDYTKKKEALRVEKNGNLGTNGEARYNAMKAASKSLLQLAAALDTYGNKGPTQFQQDLLNKPYGIEPEAIVNNWMFERQQAQVKMQATVEKTDKLLQNEAEFRDPVNALQDENNIINDNALHIPDSKEMMSSAVKTLYLASVKKTFNKDNGSVGRYADMASGFMSTISDFTKNGTASESFKNFEKNLKSSKAFTDEFTNRLHVAADTGKLSTNDIIKCREGALKSAYDKSKNDPAELKKLDKLSIEMGSATNAVSLGLKVPEQKAPAVNTDKQVKKASAVNANDQLKKAPNKIAGGEAKKK
ncbi:hypothetical protein SAMN04487934_10490 [Eubacterium ruminantium]|nr:hypothetical protein SAMN04487934_10490 [Eubacterium ruminantium]